MRRSISPRDQAGAVSRAGSWGRYESHLPEFAHHSYQHLLGIDDLVEPEPPRLRRVGHHVVLDVEDGLAEGPPGRVPEGNIPQAILPDHVPPQPLLVRHEPGQRQSKGWREGK